MSASKETPKETEKLKFQVSDAEAATVRFKDGYDNFLNRVGLNNQNTLSAGFYTLNLMTRNRQQLEAAYRGSWLVGAVVDSVADDMTRAGIDISTNEAEEDIKDLQNYIARKKVWTSFNWLIKWGRLYGGAIGVIQIAGQDLSTPLDISTVGKGQFDGLVVYDRWQLNPILDEVISSGPDVGLPRYYEIVNNPTQVDPTAPSATGTQRIHYSRVIRYVGIQLPYFQAITEMMWGESILERLWDRLVSFDNATMSCGSLIDRANLRTVSIEGLRDVIAAGGPAYDGLLKMFEMMRMMQVNEGLTLLDAKDNFASTAYSFAGLSDMMLQFGQQLAGASGIPLVRLFGQSPAGLSSTGDADIRMYYDNISAQQNSQLGDGWTILLKILWRSKFGKPAPDDLEFTFVPLWQMSDMDKASIAKTKTETVLGAFDSGLISKPTAMKELRASSGDTGIFSNISDDEVREAELEPPPVFEEPPIPKDPTGEGGPVSSLDEKPASLIEILLKKFKK